MSELLLAGAIAFAALLLALAVLGLLHYLGKRIEAMSLLQDAEAVFAKIKADVEAAAKPLHDRIAALESELAQKVADLEAALTANGGLIAELEQLGQDLVGMVTPTSAPAAPSAEAAPAA